MQRYAIMFRVKPGTEDKVKELLASYAPPEPVTADGTRLLGTSIFMKDGMVVRMLEIDGELRSVMAHLAATPSVQELERQLDQYLDQPRDMSTPGSAREFFQRSMMEHVTTRIAASDEVAK